MHDFSDLLDRLSYEPRRNAKLRVLEDYFRRRPDPERGWALAAMTGDLSFRHAKPALLRSLVAERVDPVLFALSYDYVGDLSETIALIWPGAEAGAPVSLPEVVDGLHHSAKADLPALLTRWLDTLDETGRWALLKLITGGLRIGVSARLAKTALAGLGGGHDVRDVEEVWHGQAPPYEALFAWAEGRAERPVADDPAPFRSPMLSHAIVEADFARLAPEAFVAEWKWDGIRVQAVAGRGADGRLVRRLYSRSGEEISGAFPDIVDILDFEGAVDGELLIRRDGRVQPFSELQKRLNRKTISRRLLETCPAHIRAYDLLGEDGEDLRPLPFVERRARLGALLARIDAPRIDLSPEIRFRTWDELAQARADPASAGAGDDAAAVEGLMLKRRDSPYVPGRPKGPWWKWKRDPYVVDAVLLYAQRGHGKRSSFYSDYTFGVWRVGAEGEELVPVGKAYFGFTDEELLELDRFIRNNTINRFGPVREVVHEPDSGLVLEIAFEGLNRSTRHRSGLAMRFPRISRLRRDKPPRDADRIDALMNLLPPEDHPPPPART